MKNSNQVFIVFTIILLTGILGGIGNFLNFESNCKYSNYLSLLINSSFLKSIFLGIIAAGVVPLFLNIISSNLLELDNKNTNYNNYFIFGSFCLLASLFSGKFLPNIFDNSFNKLDNRIEALAYKVDQIDDKTNATIQSNLRNVGIEDTINNLSSQDSIILNTIAKKKMIYKDSLIKDPKFEKFYNALLKNNIIKELKVYDRKVVLLNQ